LNIKELLAMNYKELQDDIQSIKTLMERSSKFISLSGLSGILAGLYALGGTAVAYWVLSDHYTGLVRGQGIHGFAIIFKLFLIALAVLVLSIVTGIFLTVRKGIKKGQSVWNPVSRNLLSTMLVPLVSGGLFIFILAFKGQHAYISASCLIFYGLALFSASHFTYDDIKWVGIIEIFLGLGAALFPGWGLWFWAMGFGIIHIIYGSIMYFKYDR